MNDPSDPLAGRDPYPREQMDVLGLHRERADLLEEIVSTPSAGPTSTRTKVLLPVGIAAALAVVGGGIWFATGGSSETADDPVAAASTSPEPTEPDQAVDPTTEPAEPDQAAPSDEAAPAVGPRQELARARPGDQLSDEACELLKDGWQVRGRSGGEALTLRMLRRQAAPSPRDQGKDLPHVLGRILARKPSGRWVVIDQSCTVLDSDDGRTTLRLKPQPQDR